MPFILEQVTLVSFVGRPDDNSRLKFELKGGQAVYVFPSWVHYPKADPWEVDIWNTSYAPLLELYSELNETAINNGPVSEHQPAKLGLYWSNRTDRPLKFGKLVYAGGVDIKLTISAEDVLNVSAISIS